MWPALKQVVSWQVQIYLDGKAVPQNTLKAWQGNKKCVTVQEGVAGGGAAGGGPVYLGMTIADDAEDVTISHVIASPGASLGREREKRASSSLAAITILLSLH